MIAGTERDRAAPAIRGIDIIPGTAAEQFDSAIRGVSIIAGTLRSGSKPAVSGGGPLRLVVYPGLEEQLAAGVGAFISKVADTESVGGNIDVCPARGGQEQYDKPYPWRQPSIHQFLPYVGSV